MKWLTIFPHMDCNSFCVFCVSRAVDEPLVAKRLAIGLTTPPDPRRKYTSKLLERMLRPPEQEGVFMPAESLPVDEARTLLQEHRGRGYTALRIQGGEPTLWEPLVPTIGLAREMGYERVEVVSNGRRLAEPAFAERLLTSGVTHVVLSLLGVDAAAHDGISLVPGSFVELTQAFESCVRLRDSGRARLQVSANIIVTAETYRSLPRQIEWLAGLGVLAGEVRLVRFAFLGNLASLRTRLAFPIEQLRGPLHEAREIAARLKFTLQTDEIPLCQHEPVTSALLARTLNRFGKHPGSGGGEPLHVDGVPSAACEKCVVAPVCPRVRREFLPAGADAVYRPIGEAMFSEQLARATDTAGREDAAKSIRQLVERGLIRDDTKDGAQQTLDGSYVSQLRTAVARGAEDDAIGALYGLLKLDRPSGYKPSGFIDRLKADPASMRKGAVVPTADGGGHQRPGAPPLERHLLTFVHGYEVLLLGRTQDDAIALAEVRATEAPAGSDPLVFAVFTEHVLEVVDSARRVRLVHGRLEGEREGQWRPLIVAATADLIRLRAAGHEPPLAPPGPPERDSDGNGIGHPITASPPRPSHLPALKAAIEAGIELDAVSALHGLLGLEPIREYQPAGFMSRLGPASLSARRVAERSTAQAGTGELREYELGFENALALKLIGRAGESGEVHVVELRAAVPPEGSDPLMFSLFVEHLLVVLDGARSLRLTGGQLDGDRNGQWVPLLKGASPGVLQLRLAPDQAAPAADAPPPDPGRGSEGNGAGQPKSATPPRSGYLPTLKAAIAEGVELDAVSALHGLLGLDPIREYQAVGFMSRLGPASLSARRVADRSTAQAGAGEAREHQLVFAESFALKLLGRAGANGEVQVVELRAALPPEGADPLVYSLFVEHMLVLLDGARSLRLQGGQLDGDRNGHWVRLLKAATPDLLRLAPAQAAAAGAPSTAA